MRILAILSRIPFPLTDGGAILSYNTLQCLHEAGNDVHVLALNTNKHFQPIEVLRGVCTRAESVPINTDITPQGALRSLLCRESYIASRFQSREFATLIADTLQKAASEGSPFDIVHLDHTLVGIYAPAIRKAISKLTLDRQAVKPPAIVLRTHNVEYLIQERLAKQESTRFAAWYRRHEAVLMRSLEQRIFAECDGVIAITPEDAAIIRDMGYSGKLEIVPAGVNVETFTRKPAIPIKPDSLCYIGGMDWLPNVEAVQWFAQAVMPLLKDSLPSATFHIAGKKMTKSVKTLVTVTNITVYPDVPSAAEFLQAHEILVVPLLSGGGMRLKIIEAMALGMPIISTHIGAEGVNVRDGESILFADTPEEFQAAILKLSENPDLKRSLGENAARIAQSEYAWTAVVERQLGFYRKLLRTK